MPNDKEQSFWVLSRLLNGKQAWSNALWLITGDILSNHLTRSDLTSLLDLTGLSMRGDGEIEERDLVARFRTISAEEFYEVWINYLDMTKTLNPES
jgi:hypothetical protein